MFTDKDEENIGDQGDYTLTLGQLATSSDNTASKLLSLKNQKHDIKELVDNNSIELIIPALEYGADFNIDIDQEPFPIWAIKKKHIDILKKVIEKGANVNALDPVTGWSLLHLAIIEKHFDIAVELIRQGARVNTEDAEQWTVLHAALNSQNEQLIELLLENGVDIGVKYKDETVVEYLLNKEIFNKKIVELLVRNGAEYDMKKIKNEVKRKIPKEVSDILYYPQELLYSELKALLKTIEKLSSNMRIDLELAKIKIAASETRSIKKDLNKLRNYIKNLKEYIICFKNYNSIIDAIKNSKEFDESLLNDDKIFVQRNSEEYTLLTFAVKQKNVKAVGKIVKRIIEKKSSVDEKDGMENTALSIACQISHPEIINILVENGASLDITDKQGRTPLMIALLAENTELIGILGKNFKQVLDNRVKKEAEEKIKKNQTPKKYYECEPEIKVAAQKGVIENIKNDKEIKFLLDPELILQYRDDKGNTLLMLAVQSGKVERVREILEKIAEINKADEGRELLGVDKSSQDQTLNSDITLQERRKIKEERDKKVDINSKNNIGGTAFSIATINGDLDIMKLLLENGADINAKNIVGHTPLMTAALYQRPLKELQKINEPGKGTQKIILAEDEYKKCLLEEQKNRSIKTIKFLLDNKADPDVKATVKINKLETEKTALDMVVEEINKNQELIRNTKLKDDNLRLSEELTKSSKMDNQKRMDRIHLLGEIRGILADKTTNRSRTTSRRPIIQPDLIQV